MHISFSPGKVDGQSLKLAKNILHQVTQHARASGGSQIQMNSSKPSTIGDCHCETNSNADPDASVPA